MASDKASSFWIAFYVLGMLATGTLNTITVKVQFTMQSIGVGGHVQTFQKPWFGTWNMMEAMALVGLCEWIGRCLSKPPSDKEVPLIDKAPASSGPGAQVSYRKKALLVSVPAAFDLLATALCCIGMLYIPASVWQMLRGSALVFTAIFSIIFLHRRMRAYQWFGICFCVVGVVCVGMANVLGEEEASGSDSSGSSDGSDGNGTSMLMFGMFLVLMGQVVQAAQVIAEEYLMKVVDLPGMQVVGLEGFWGLLMMILVVYPALMILPGADHGHQEDIVDTLVMLQNNPNLLLVVGLYLFSCGSFNAFGIRITGYLSSVHRMMLDASRTTLIWGFGLFVHYRVDPDSAFGEVWTVYSYLQLLGFVIIIFGQATYAEVIRLPFFTYPAADVFMIPSPSAAMNLSSPLPPHRDD
mmetsp:Transcript_63213/g.150755  ORF Transcript_63213/g.150755 Transcript_63213/m.150755 type:complete len:410 (+) Transcript_63213:102-1331(+)